MKFPLLWLILYLAGAGAGGAVEVTEGPVTVVSEAEAVLKWTTDVECGTQVKLGRKRNNFNRRVEGGVGLTHEVKITELLPGTTYYYSIGTAKKALKEGAFLTKRSPSAGTAPVMEREVPMPVPPVVKSGVKPPPVSMGAVPVYTPPPTGKSWGDRWSLRDHFNRHGTDFGAASPDDYAAKAWLFLQRAKDEGLSAKLDEGDGTIRVWEGKTHSFAAYNRNFTTRTFFKPDSPDYFKRQPGKPVRLRHAPAAP